MEVGAETSIMDASNTPHNKAKEGEKSRLSYLALLGCNLLWAMDYPLYHILLPRHLHPVVLLAAALLMTALLALIPLLRHPVEPVERRDIPTLLGAAILLGVLHKGLMMCGLSRTSPIDGAIINTAGPLIVLLLSVLWGLDHLTKRKVAGLCLGITGAIGVILWGGDEAHEKSDLIGNLMVVGSVTATAVYTVWLKKLLAKYRVTTILMWVYCLAAALVLPFGIATLLREEVQPWDGRTIAAFVIVMCLLTYLPNFLYNMALKRTKPVETSIFGYLQPVAAIALSVLLGLDRLHLDTLFFALVIFVGIALVIGSYAKGKSLPHPQKGR